jgi:hypothetical protein
MKPVEKTYEILAWKHLNRSVNANWSTWAAEMMSAGFETEHLIELAGISKPYNQFELSDLTDKVFEELELDTTDRVTIISNYATYLVKQVIHNERELFPTLVLLKNLCIELDYDEKLYDFYSLFFAKDDLNYAEVQWYWDGANKVNIDQICIDYFNDWLEQNPQKDLA